MIFDEFNEFADVVAAQNEAGTDLIGDVIDLGLANQDVGNGQVVYLIVIVGTAADGGAGNAGTIRFQLASDSVAAIATDGNQSVHFSSAAMLPALLTAGAIFIFPIPLGGGVPYERFLGFQTVQAVEGEDDMTVSAFLTLDPRGFRAHPQASI